MVLLSFSTGLMANPFYFACQDKEVNTEHLNTGFFSNKMPRIDQDQKVNTLGLTGKILKNINLKIEESDTLLRNISYCIQNPTLNKCLELNIWVTQEIPRYVKEARFHVSLAQSAHNPRAWLREPSYKVNKDLSVWSQYKELPWEAITVDEELKAQEALDHYQAQINSAIEKKLESKEIKPHEVNKAKNKALLKVRYQHFLRYQEMMGQLHLLNFISSADPDVRDIERALEKVQELLEKEKAYIAQINTEYEIQNNTTMLATNNLLRVFHYTNIVEQALLKDHRYCNLAAAVINYRNRRMIKFALGVGLPVMASSFFVPPLAGIGVGLLAGGGFAAHSQLKLTKMKQAYLSSIYGDEYGIETRELSTQKRTRDFEVVITPLGLGLFNGAISKTGQRVIGAQGKTLSKANKATSKINPKGKIAEVVKKYSKKLIK